jgi:hypothetical protein
MRKRYPFTHVGRDDVLSLPHRIDVSTLHGPEAVKCFSAQTYGLLSRGGRSA